MKYSSTRRDCTALPRSGVRGSCTAVFCVWCDCCKLTKTTSSSTLRPLPPLKGSKRSGAHKVFGGHQLKKRLHLQEVRIVEHGVAPLLHNLGGGKLLKGQPRDGLAAPALHRSDKVLYKVLFHVAVCNAVGGPEQRVEHDGVLILPAQGCLGDVVGAVIAVDLPVLSVAVLQRQSAQTLEKLGGSQRVHGDHSEKMQSTGSTED
ncbi:hypothetical protein JZ751_006295 [Albula glossodonta]|uniref:Uncharacterized protein n=1 Tax=Albula glossodonta TaxID=121402 RepID=A0A8T2MXZ2_9TELE|nr:hypothetical protein JZ751_006295 [Albula glossodonta]